MLRFIAGKRLALGRLTVVDATNVQPEARKPLRRAGPAVPLPAGGDRARPARAVCQERNRARTDRNFGPHVVRNQKSQLRRSLARAPQGRLPAYLRDRDARGGRGRHRRARARSGTTGAPSTGRSTSSAMSTAAATSWRNCSDGSATRRSQLDGDDPHLGQSGLSSIPRAARRSSSATWWTVARASSTRCGWCGTWSLTARPCASPATTT